MLNIVLYLFQPGEGHGIVSQRAFTAGNNLWPDGIVPYEINTTSLSKKNFLYKLISCTMRLIFYIMFTGISLQKY